MNSRTVYQPYEFFRVCFYHRLLKTFYRKPCMAVQQTLHEFLHELASFVFASFCDKSHILRSIKVICILSAILNPSQIYCKPFNRQHIKSPILTSVSRCFAFSCCTKVAFEMYLAPQYPQINGNSPVCFLW